MGHKGTHRDFIMMDYASYLSMTSYGRCGMVYRGTVQFLFGLQVKGDFISFGWAGLGSSMASGMLNRLHHIMEGAFSREWNELFDSNVHIHTRLVPTHGLAILKRH